jgi:hypothetical protein
MAHSRRSVSPAQAGVQSALQNSYGDELSLPRAMTRISKVEGMQAEANPIQNVEL